MTNNFFITTPIYYVNDTPHIGHAYTSLACDVLARYKRLQGLNVHFLTGTDEHGQKVQKAAQNANLPPQIFTNQISNNFKQLASIMNLSINDFIRTTEPRHKNTVTLVWNKLVQNNQIYLGKYSGWYAVRDEAFYNENEIITLPNGDKQATSGANVEWLEEPSYFFRLSQWQDKLLNFYNQNPNFLAPEHRKNEVVSFVKSGLHDLSVSRTSFSWGIPVPNDNNHVIYVWLDALLNYLSATNWPQQQNLWPANIHMVGKDILRFHAVYWPAFLMAADLPLPKRVFGHGWLLNHGRKMSKSEGNVLKPDELIQRYGLDPLRYYLMREVPFGQDGYISHDTIIARTNAELSNGIGNLAQRSLSMVAKNLNGKAPQLKTKNTQETIYQNALTLPNRVTPHIDNQAFHLALDEIWQLIGEANRYFDANTPWKLAKQNDPKLQTVLATTLEVVRIIAVMLYPFMPQSIDALLAQLGTNIKEGLASLSNPLPERDLPAPVPVFVRLQEDA